MSLDFFRNFLNRVFHAAAHQDRLQGAYYAALGRGMQLPAFTASDAVMIYDHQHKHVELVGREKHGEGFQYHSHVYSLRDFRATLEKIVENNQKELEHLEYFSLVLEQIETVDKDSVLYQRLTHEIEIDAALFPLERVVDIFQQRAAIRRSIEIFEKETGTQVNDAVKFHDTLRVLEETEYFNKLAPIHLRQGDITGGIAQTLIEDFDSGNDGGRQTRGKVALAADNRKTIAEIGLLKASRN